MHCFKSCKRADYEHYSLSYGKKLEKWQNQVHSYKVKIEKKHWWQMANSYRNKFLNASWAWNVQNFALFIN